MSLAYVTSLSSSALGTNGGTTSSVDTTGSKLIVIGIPYYYFGAGITLSDSESNTWTLGETAATHSVTSFVWYYCINPSVSASHTFTATGSSTYPRLVMAAYSGTSISFNKKSSAVNGGTSVATGNITPDQDNSLIVSIVGHNVAETQSVSGTLTIRQNTPRNTGVEYGAAIADEVQTTAASVGATWSSAASDSRLAVIAAFYDTPAPASTPRVPLVITDGVKQQLQSGDLLEDTVYSTGSTLSTDNALVRVDGTGGQNIQESNALLADSGELSLTSTSSLETSGSHSSILTVIDSAGNHSFEITAFLKSTGNQGLGFDALSAVTSGTDNTAIGYESGLSLTTGDNNVFLGSGAGYHASQKVDADNSIAIGYGVYTTASNQVVIGNSSTTETVLQSLLKVESHSSLEGSGAHMPAVSFHDSNGDAFIEFSSQLASTGNMIIAVNSGDTITTGTNNTLIGRNAGQALTTGTNCMFFGSSAGYSNQTGTNNTAIGLDALYSGTGSSNMAIGSYTLFDYTGNASTAIGAYSLTDATGTSNTAIGHNSGRSIVTGTYNTFIGGISGYHASQDTAADYSIAIGYGTYTTKDYQVVLGSSSIGETVLRGSVLTGGGAYNTLRRVSKTADYALVDETFALVDCTSGDVTITLPAAADWTDTPFYIKRTDGSANAVTVDGNGAETIDGATTVSLPNQYDHVTVVSDGTTWWVI